MSRGLSKSRLQCERKLWLSGHWQDLERTFVAITAASCSGQCDDPRLTFDTTCSGITASPTRIYKQTGFNTERTSLLSR